MALATFHSLRGANKTSCLIMVKKNPLQYSADPAYVPLAGAEHFAGKTLSDADKGLAFEIPDGFTLENIVDIETGEIRTATNGEPLKQLVY